jgi:AraC-like DNA-binding protein
LLICILKGKQELARKNNVTLHPPGSFIFLSNKTNVEIRHIPIDEAYVALSIEFEIDDFTDFSDMEETKTESFFQGEIDIVLEQTLRQFVDWSRFAEPKLWPIRKVEILRCLYHQGYKQVATIAKSPYLRYQVHKMISNDIADGWSARVVASKLAMGESTLRRKLNAEGTNLREIKEKAKLSYGLYLVQTSIKPLGQIARQCGYKSSSHFTNKFKYLFGVTPSELRKIR